MSASLSDLIPEFQPFARELVDAAGAAGLLPRITSTLRTRAQQDRLYRDYLRGGRGFPVAPPGTSAHEYGYAFDMVVSPMDALWDVGQVWIQAGGVWGPGDAIHFEYPGFKEDLASGAIGTSEIPSLNTAAQFWDTVAGILIPPLGAAQAVQALFFKDNVPLAYLTSPTLAAHWLHEHVLGGRYP